MQIRVTEVPMVESEGTYSYFKLKYDQDGTPKEKRVVSFGPNEPVYKILVRAKPEQVYNIKAKKNEKNPKYWDWVEASVVEDGSDSTGTGGTTKTQATKAGGTWETAEERAAKQIYIIRQSSIGSAVELLKANMGSADVKISEVLDVAKQFEDYVFGRNQPPAEID